MTTQNPINAGPDKQSTVGFTAPETDNNQDTTKHRRKKRLLILLVALLLLVVGGASAIAYFMKDENNKTNTPVPATNMPSEARHSVLCFGLGLRSVQCEDLETKEIRKYDLPESVHNVTRMVPNKAGEKVFVEAWKTNDTDTNPTESFTIYDNKLKPLATLPKTDTNNIQDISWLDNDTIMYTVDSGTAEKTIYAFNVASSKETPLMNTESTIERFIPSGDRRFIYGIQGLLDEPSNSIVRKLVVIDAETKSVKDVNNTVVNVDKQDLGYSQASSLFYANILLQAEQKFNLAMYKVDGLADKPTLRAVGQIDNTKYVVPYAYLPVVTEKGILAQPGTDLSLRAPAKLYTATNEYRELKLAIGGSGNIMLQLHGFPDFPRAKTDKAVTRDFFRPPAGTPGKIVAFLDKMVTKNPECESGEYTTFELRTNDGDKQFSVLQNGCESDYLAIYERKGETYKIVATTREGMSCERRNSLGISAKTYPDCRKPGEGI